MSTMTVGAPEPLPLERMAARAATIIAPAEAAIGSLAWAALLDTPGLDALEA